MHSASTAEGRYKNIDVLRGIAAIFVVWLHAGEVLVTIPAIKVFGTLAHDIPEFLQLGRAGVIAFFAISGFVVASTIKPPKGEGTAHFATKRLLRLYPAYWLALALTYLFIWVPQGRFPSAASAVANATMLPTVFGIESAMGHFWTLEIEFVFYVLVVVLFLSGKLRDPRLIVPLTCLLALMPATFVMGKLTWTSGQGHWRELPLCLAIMLWGSLLRASYDPNAGARQKLRAWRGRSPSARYSCWVSRSTSAASSGGWTLSPGSRALGPCGAYCFSSLSHCAGSGGHASWCGAGLRATRSTCSTP